MKRQLATLSLAGMLLATAGISQATILGFGQIGGNNTNIEQINPHYGSNVAANGNGVDVSNGATPNIAINWGGTDWDVHDSPHFTNVENQTIGGGDWDNQGSRRVGQLDSLNQSIEFVAEPGYAFVLNSFDFGNSREASNTTVWDLVLADSNSNTVWAQQVTLSNPNLTDVVTATPNFVGNFGASYVLTFRRVSDDFNNGLGEGGGRHALDNLSFNQIAVPEPSTIALAGLGLVGLVAAVRRQRG